MTVRSKTSAQKVGIAAVISGFLVALLLLLPGTAAGLTADLQGFQFQVTPPGTATFSGTVNVDAFDTVNEVELIIEGPSATVTVDLPVPALNSTSPVSASVPNGLGTITGSATNSGVGFQGGVGYGYGYGYSGSSTSSSLTYSLTWAPTTPGLYHVQLRAIGSAVVTSSLVTLTVNPTDTGGGPISGQPTTPAPTVTVTPPANGVARTVEPGRPTRVETSGGDITIDVPHTAFTRPVQMTVAPVPTGTVPEPPAGFGLVKAFEINVFDLSGNRLSVVSGQPFTITVRYTVQDVARAGGDPNRIVVMRFVPGRGWVQLTTTVNTSNMTLTAQVPGFSTFALAVRTTVGDINTDGVVDYRDLAILASAYGARAGDANFRTSADLNSDGTINQLDLALLGSNYGSGR